MAYRILNDIFLSDATKAPDPSSVQSKTFVRLTRPPAGQSLKRSNLSPPPMEDAAVPEGAPAPGASLVSCNRVFSTDLTVI